MSSNLIACFSIPLILMLVFFTVFLIMIFSFFEAFIFNDEIFLALCFITFLSFVYNFLNVLFLNVMQDRSKKYESDLFFSSKAELSFGFLFALQVTRYHRS
jgi:hypothetical protein